MLVVDEEIGLVAAIVNMRNFERAAEIAAEALVITAGLWNFGASQRKGFGIECGIVVAIVEAEAHAIHRLAAEPSAPSEQSSASATTAGTAARAASSPGAAASARTAGASAVLTE